MSESNDKNMKKQVINMVSVAALAFLAGATFNDWLFNISEIYEANNFKKEVIKAQDKVILKAEEVIDNNNLYDTDGSDTMSEYMEALAVIDSLYRVQQ